MGFFPFVPTAGNVALPVPVVDGGTGQAAIPAAFTALAASGGTMGGTLAMGANKVTGLANGSAATDAATFGQVPLVEWVPADQGLLAWNCDPFLPGSTTLLTGGTVYLLRVNIRYAITWTNVIVAVTTAGDNTGGSGGTFTGLYSPAGTLLSGSADVASSLTSNGTKTLALSTPQALTAGTFVWVAILVNLGTTQPQLARTNAATQTSNANLTAATFRVAVNGTGATSLPSSITPAANTDGTSQSLWVAAT